MIRRRVCLAAAIALIPVLCAATTAGAVPGKWTVVKGAALKVTGNFIGDVSCHTRSCMAVGWQGGFFTEHPLVEHVTLPGAWTNVTPKSNLGAFFSVSCPTSTFCMAVGTTHLVQPGYLAAAYWHNGVWTKASPKPLTLGSSLEGVSCVSQTHCVAVGSESTGTSTYEDVTETWNGSSWSISALNRFGAQQGDLRSVSCTSTTFCLAVGTYGTTSGGTSYTSMPAALVLHGSLWSTTLNPTAPSNESYFDSVSCVAANACQVVGADSTSGARILDEWTVSGWTQESTAALTAGTFRSVSCSVLTNCFFVGYYVSGSGIPIGNAWRAQAFHLIGAAWQVATMPLAGAGGGNALEAVSCPSTTRCEAGGLEATSVGASPHFGTLFERGVI